MKCRYLSILLLFLMILSACSSDESKPGESDSTATMPNTELVSDSQSMVIPPSSSFNIVSPMYEKGCESIEALMEDSTLVVRAVPVSVENESDFAICLVLDVIDASQSGIETIRIRQMKDEYQLTMGQEVVLALAPDEGEGYYHIPAGGAGLFYNDEATGHPAGMLLNDLLANSPAPLSADGQTTLDNIFNLLCAFEKYKSFDKITLDKLHTMM